MGMLFPVRWQIRDALGNGLSGAKVRIYEENTTTLASVYSDAGLTTPLTNPIVADSAGILPPIFAAEGALFDVAELTSADAVIRTADSVPAVGADSGTWLRDFGTSRARVAGSGGVTSFEAGPPVGDDVGGAVRLGGYESTQADTAEIDAAATTVTGSMDVSGALNADGLITENSKKLYGVVQETTSPAAAAGIDLALTETPANVRAWSVEGIDIVMSATATVNLTLSYDGGATFKTGATDYGFTRSVQAVTSTTVGSTSTQNEAAISTTTQTPTGKPGRLNMTIATVESGNGDTVIEGRMYAHDNSGTPVPLISHFVAYGHGNYGRATHVKISVSSGTITGTFRIVPLRGFGE